MHVAAANPGRSYVDQTFAGAWSRGRDGAEVEFVGGGGCDGEVLLKGGHVVVFRGNG